VVITDYDNAGWQPWYDKTWVEIGTKIGLKPDKTNTHSTCWVNEFENMCVNMLIASYKIIKLILHYFWPETDS
jgi:hypothetical protein